MADIAVESIPPDSHAPAYSSPMRLRTAASSLSLNSLAISS